MSPDEAIILLKNLCKQERFTSLEQEALTLGIKALEEKKVEA